ncbi:hypothetical protein PSTG_05469 [Puccinia striiformis f. sp. tritici PST-78]|uniref:HTH CENPB-type domain-containing protein n=1 Tax=Puccinia striiformis f. sp. tritici PST-78 TaxID=1165861 RepID=A0A0L0VQ21_9BASI|nr:hypothetical protein PSTG_05469 [Puccinia striiformis f. sp. tritici PST-78]
MSASNQVSKNFSQILAISYSCPKIPQGTQDDLIFQRFSCPPIIPEDEEDEGIAPQDPSWNADELLVPKLERIYKCFEDAGGVLRQEPPKKPLPKKTTKASSLQDPSMKDSIQASSLQDPAKKDSRSSTSLQDPSKDNSASRKPSQSQKALTTGDPESRLDASKKRTTSSRKVHDPDFKLKVIQWHQEHKATQLETSRKFNINQTLLPRWLKAQETMQTRVTYNGGLVKRQQTAAHPQLEQALFNWFMEAQSCQMTTNDEILRTKAHKFANLLNVNLKLSNGWLNKFKSRFHINKIELHGEADETGLLYEMPPNKSLATKTCSGLKGSKVRLTYHLCCNVDGSDKLKPLIIGNAQKPRSFGKKFASFRGYDYHHNKTAWMTATIMALWLQKLDSRFRREKRQVLLLLDNFSAHIKRLDGLHLANLKVEFPPPNLTSVLQPCDAGIIRAFKAYYRKRFPEFAMSRYEENPDTDGTTAFNISQLEAMHMARAAWALVTQKTIANCWKHTGILRHPDNTDNTSTEPLNRNNLIASDEDLETIVRETKNSLDKLSRYPDIPESSKKSRISIENLLNPAAESKLVHDIIPMPTEEEIVASMQQEANADTEENQEEQSESEDQPEPIPWNLTKMKAALNEIEFGLLSQPVNKFASAWMPHIDSLQSQSSQIGKAQWSGLKQTTLDSFIEQ